VSEAHHGALPRPSSALADLLARLHAALADRYTIERALGAGGMATVYLARDLKHHRLVAVKVLKPDLGAALGPDRFLREIATAARLTHPHILPLHDSGEADGFLYYVMPYVEGESLRDRLNRDQQLSIDDALQIARDVASALSAPTATMSYIATLNQRTSCSHPGKLWWAILGSLAR